MSSTTNRRTEFGRGFRIGCLAACLGLLAAGCSGSSNPATVKVKGKVTYAGQPVTAGTVTFQPLSSEKGAASRPATGIINSDGTYELSTFAKGDGALPGEYRVLVVTMTGGPTPEDPTAKEVWATPKKYGNPVETPLKATVPAKGPLEKNLDLEK